MLHTGCLSARLAELTAALERRRSEDEEKERAVEALTLQLRELVGAGCGGLGMQVHHSRSDPIPGLQEATRAREPTPEQVQALRSELELLRRTLHEITQVLGHPQPGGASPCLRVPCLPQCPLPASVSPSLIRFCISFFSFPSP